MHYEKCKGSYISQALFELCYTEMGQNWNSLSKPPQTFEICVRMIPWDSESHGISFNTWIGRSRILRWVWKQLDCIDGAIPPLYWVGRMHHGTAAWAPKSGKNCLPLNLWFPLPFPSMLNSNCPSLPLPTLTSLLTPLAAVRGDLLTATMVLATSACASWSNEELG